MRRFTQKYMISDYERLREHADLLDLYLYDTQTNAPIDAVEERDSVRVELRRATSVSGGYVVIRQVISNIWTLDEAIRIWEERTDVASLPIRICLERIRIQRDKLFGMEDLCLNK